MRSIAWAAAGAILSSFCGAENLTKPLSSKQVLPSTFAPPQHFKHTNLVRNVNLEKGYPRETINVVVQNVDSAPQGEYYLPFAGDLIGKVGGLEVRDKKDPEKPPFAAEVVEFDAYSPTQFYLIRLPEPLKPKADITLSISYYVLSSLVPLPASIEQKGKQYLQYTFSAFSPSAYPTTKQKTKLKFPSTDIPDYTVLPLKSSSADKAEDPTRQGSTFTYGPYDAVPAGAAEPVQVRYEFTKPVVHAALLERDVEVSHWGGNLATEERYWLENRGAALKGHFSRLEWQMQSYASPTSAALKELRVPLRAGAANPYFIDDIGNVSTSRFRGNDREALLELKPRYPVFGGWKYSFRIGWDANLGGFLRRIKGGEGYVLKVPFLEGPRATEGMEYERVVSRIILPEGATNVEWSTTVPLVASEISSYRTFMDTLGRTALELTAVNLVDEWRDRDIIVTYEYSISSALRKPVTIFVTLLGVFVAAWAIGKIDVSIGSQRKDR